MASGHSGLLADLFRWSASFLINRLLSIIISRSRLAFAASLTSTTSGFLNIELLTKLMIEPSSARSALFISCTVRAGLYLLLPVLSVSLPSLRFCFKRVALLRILPSVSLTSTYLGVALGITAAIILLLTS